MRVIAPLVRPSPSKQSDTPSSHQEKPMLPPPPPPPSQSPPPPTFKKSPLTTVKSSPLGLKKSPPTSKKSPQQTLKKPSPTGQRLLHQAVKKSPPPIRKISPAQPVKKPSQSPVLSSFGPSLSKKPLSPVLPVTNKLQPPREKAQPSRSSEKLLSADNPPAQLPENQPGSPLLAEQPEKEPPPSKPPAVHSLPKLPAAELQQLPASQSTPKPLSEPHSQKPLAKPSPKLQTDQLRLLLQTPGKPSFSPSIAANKPVS